MSRILIDDYILDDETGEIVSAPAGTDRARLAAFRLAECDEQLDEWKKDRAIWAAALKRHQPVKKAEYSDAVDTTVTATISEQTNRVQDVTAFKQLVLETELSRDDLLALVLASTPGNWRAAWKTDLLPDDLAAALADMTHERTGEPFVRVTRSKKRAAKAVLEPDPDELVKQMEETIAALRAEKGVPA